MHINLINSFYLKQIKENVRAPAKNEYKNDDKCHFDCFDFSLWDETSGTCSPEKIIEAILT